jgi:hypothetical protein
MPRALTCNLAPRLHHGEGLCFRVLRPISPTRGAAGTLSRKSVRTVRRSLISDARKLWRSCWRRCRKVQRSLFRKVRAKRSMIALNFGSFTFSTACEAECHFATRSCFSGHRLFWRLTSRGKTRTSQTTAPPFFSRFSYENEPTERLATAPTTPASSKASRSLNDGATCPFLASPSE